MAAGPACFIGISCAVTSPAPTVSAPVPVSMLRVPTDRFFCAPYRVTMAAKGCVERQAIVREGSRRADWGNCVNCGLGRQVEHAVGAVKAEKARPGKPARVAQEAPPPRLAEAPPPPEPVAETVAAPALPEPPPPIEQDVVETSEAASNDVDPVPSPEAEAPCPARCAIAGCDVKIKVVRVDGLCGYHRQATVPRQRATGTGQVFCKGSKWYAKEPERKEGGKRKAPYLGSFDTEDEAHAACDRWTECNGGPKIDAIMPTCSEVGCPTVLNARSLEAGDGLCGVHRVAAKKLTPAEEPAPIEAPKPPPLIVSSPRSRSENDKSATGEAPALDAPPSPVADEQPAIFAAEFDREALAYSIYAEWLLATQRCAEAFVEAKARPPARLTWALADQARSYVVSIPVLEELIRLERATSVSAPDDSWDRFHEVLWKDGLMRELLGLAKAGLLTLHEETEAAQPASGQERG